MCTLGPSEDCSSFCCHSCCYQPLGSTGLGKNCLWDKTKTKKTKQALLPLSPPIGASLPSSGSRKEGFSWPCASALLEWRLPWTKSGVLRGQDTPISAFHQVLISHPDLSENCSVSFCVIFLVVISGRDGVQCACLVSARTGSCWWHLFSPKYSLFCFICYNFIKVEFTCQYSLTLSVPFNDFSKFTELWNDHHSPILAHFHYPTHSSCSFVVTPCQFLF